MQIFKHPGVYRAHRLNSTALNINVIFILLMALEPHKTNPEFRTVTE